ncbi:hypothetical protein GCM10027594_23410 [Hymenobacter agri]
MQNNSLATGDNHSLSIHPDGTLWAWGGNGSGQLGDGTTTDRLTPVQIGTATTWRTVSAGTNFSLALSADGTLWAWGGNQYGQLGDGTITDQSSPMQVGTDRNWQSVSAGYQFSTAVRADGTLWTWGFNQFGRLGNYGSSSTDDRQPGQVGTATTWRTVSAGKEHSLSVTTAGYLVSWGGNAFGELGDNSTTNKPFPVQVGTATTWQSASAGTSHSLAVRTDGTLWAWGDDTYGQRGDGTGGLRTSPSRIGTATTWRSIQAGYTHSLALRTDGTLWTWGTNAYGQLGDGTLTRHSTPVQLGTATWQSISTGSYYSVALRTDGTLWAAGQNNYSQLGIPSSTNFPLLIFNPNGALPVELTAFTAAPTAGAVRLAWATASEKNSLAFEAERSLDGQSFGRIGTVAAAGSSSSLRSYELLDATLPSRATTLYYRLRQVDQDGTFRYSPVRTVALPGAAAGLSLYPNPATNGAVLKGAVPGTTVTVFDTLGRPMVTVFADAAGTAVLTLPAGLPLGVYVVHAGNQGMRLTVE